MTYLIVLRANARKVVTEMVRYLPNTVALLVTGYAIFLALLLGIRVVGDPAGAADDVRYAIVANAFWLLLLLGINSMGFEISTEATRGTLEQLYMSPVPARWILFARVVATLAVQLVVMAILVLASMATARVWLHVDLAALAVLFPPTLTAVAGLGFAVAGLALVFKQVQALLQVAQFAYLAVAFVPLSLSPWLAAVPSLPGIDMVRRVLVDGAALTDFGPGAWSLLLVNAGAWLLVGLAAYRLAERRAMDRGLLGQY